MHRFPSTPVVVLVAAACASLALAEAPERTAKQNGHYLFAWAGDPAGQGTDFLAVIDADPASPAYGRLVTTVATDQPTKLIHHTEYTMPPGGLLFANDHYAGRTFVLDLRDPLQPKVAASFTDMDGYSHPHSFLRLPNGNVLASFQHGHAGHAAGESPRPVGWSRSTTQARSSARPATPIRRFPAPC